MVSPESFAQNYEREQRPLNEEEIRAGWGNYTAEYGVPEALVIEPTSRCDMGTCPACYMNSECGRGDDMTPETFANVLACIKESLPEGEKLGQVWIPGGEPTLVDNLPEIINASKDVAGEVCLVTNGLNLANYEYARDLIERSDLDEIAITLSSGNADLDNLLRAADDDPIWRQVPEGDVDAVLAEGRGITSGAECDFHERVMQGIVNVSQIKKELDKDFRVAINLNMHHGADLDELLRAVEDRGGHIDLVLFQAFQPAGRGVVGTSRSFEWQAHTEEMWREYIRQAEEAIRDGRLGAAVFVDPAPREIEEALDLENCPFYEKAVETPAFDQYGRVRANVVS
ncbi:radical SAM protein [Candidatus Saccharibacteria bacterium]|nr:radical SAM protein [Candidatus Saccharibacteria bacterium]